MKKKKIETGPSIVQAGYVTEDNFKLWILLLPPLKSWDTGCVCAHKLSVCGASDWARAS